MIKRFLAVLALAAMLLAAPSISWAGKAKGNDKDGGGPGHTTGATWE
jgi:hypothetical protein